MTSDLTHFDENGKARMVDVGSKIATHRIAVASATIKMKPETLVRIKDGEFSKGNVLEVARLAGIMATKRTADLIPLCHPIAVTSVHIDFEIVGDDQVVVSAKVEAHDRTGVEMEAMTAATASALTIYDMCKSVDRGMEILNVKLMHKSGGKSGSFDRQ
jgi:cyclic pyranopterin phosphate synthase